MPAKRHDLPAVRLHDDVIDAPPPLIGTTVSESSRITGLSRSIIYDALADGRLAGVKAGTRTIVLVESLRTFILGLPPYRSGSGLTQAATAARQGKDRAA
ncbi:hypothetical protein AAFN86_28790 [Roseomonas sp. CAU 1739]|uniref:hypothetical protein n=1 Tax=Roseomonas sp. CAU 1739 TaxID=3140364 RepID=UPI00325B54DE